MSEQPPRTPFTPIYTPELSRDANGNFLYRDAQGHWLPYNGPLPSQQQAMSEHTAQQLGHIPANDRSRGGPSSPIEHAFAPQVHTYFPLYIFILHTAPCPKQHPAGPIPIDPALLPLPGGADLNLRDSPTIANAIGLKRAEKVGGSRRKGKERTDPKGKKRQRASSVSDNDSEPIAKRGRPQGSANYGKEDVRKMFDLVAELLPLGQKGWKEVERRYNKWAKQNGRAERPPKALENKYKQYLRQKKPTGSGTCPPEVKRAHEIEDLINQRIGTRELSDSEFDDRSDDGLLDDDIEVVERTTIARCAPTPPLPRKSRARGTDLANKLANTFDPEVQKDRDEARARRSFENTQILTLSQQLRDERATTETLRSENNILRNRIHDVEQALERVELRNEMMSFAGGHRGRSPRRPRHSPRLRRSRPLGYHSHKRDPGIERVNGKIRYPSTDDYDEDDEEENHSPWDAFDVPCRPRSRHMGSRHPISRRRTPSAGPSHRRISRRHTPTPGPSRLPALLPSPSPPPAPFSFLHSANTVDTHVPAPSITGHAVELVLTPQRGPAVALVISPTKQPNTFNGNP
ncbi:hypothetical protein B0H14DRAFT_2730640 [Mycena olivaceomarginata]|nr:hypothetical protein B0H14DRAFT_2730640 [Mycena olivaceomarginata]